MSDKFTIRWCDTVDDIDTYDWTSIYGTDIIKSRQFFKANEAARFKDVEFHYLQVFKGSKIVSIVPCFSYRMDLLNIATSPSAKKWMVCIRKIFPSFFQLRAFVTGSYAATCEHFIEYLPTITPTEVNELSEIISSEIKKRSHITKSSFVFIKDVRERGLLYVKDILTSDYRFFVSFPTTAIPIIKETPYPQALRKKNRKRYRNFKAQFDELYKWEIWQDFSGSKAVQFYELYKSVLDKAKNKFEFLNPHFFSNISTMMGNRSFLLVARDKEHDEIRVMELVLEHEDKLIPLYLGIKYKKDDTKVLYLNTIFRTVKEAEFRGKSYVDLGQTSYYPKTMSGALVENIYYGFWSGRPLIKWMIKNVLNKVFNKPAVPAHVYLADYAKVAHSVLEEKGFALIN